MVKNFDFNVDTQIANNNATQFFELYKLYKSYAAYINLLSKAKQLHDVLQEPISFDSSKRPTLEELLEVAKKTGDWDVLDAYYVEETKEEETKDLLEVCFEDQNKDLFSLIKSGDCLICEPLESFASYDKIFLLPDKDKLLIIESYLNLESNLNEYFIKANLFEFGKHCKGKIFMQEVSCFSSSDGWNYRDEPAFAFVDPDKPFYEQKITPVYSTDEQLKIYDNVDIRDILTPMSLEEIAYRLKTSTEEKAKRLTLLR
jgi:hypothetical protein